MAGEGPGWMSRDFIRYTFRYPFDVLGLNMVFGMVPSGNTTALKIDLKLGFTELIYIEGAHPDGGLHLLQLTRENWKRSKSPEAPDLTALAGASTEIAEMNIQWAREQQQWAQQQDSMNREILGRVLDVQLPIMQQQYDNAREDRERYETTFRPIEDNLIKEFQEYDGPERMALERGRAAADVSTAFDAQRRNALQRLESYGVDPSQTRNAALDLGTRVQQAAATAGAMSNATRNVENTGRGLRAEGINIGRGLPSNVAASYGQSIAAGQSGIGGANQTTATSTGALGSSLAGLQGASNAYGQAANIHTQGYQNQLAQYGANSANMTGVLGAAGGVAGMMLADGGRPGVGRRRALTIDNDTGEAVYNSQPGPIDYGPGDGSGIDDQVNIKASTGEYIIPADVVRKKGEEFFDKLVERYHTPAAQQESQAAAAHRVKPSLTAPPQ
jgi:hypothetical protein